MIKLPEPEFAKTSLTADGSEVRITPEGTAVRLNPNLATPVVAGGGEIEADPHPTTSSKVKPLWVALPVAALVFIIAYFFLGKRGSAPKNAKETIAAEFTDPADLSEGSDFRG